jgi:hypothetical protein
LHINVGVVDLGLAVALRGFVRIAGCDIDCKSILSAFPEAVFFGQIYHDLKLHYLVWIWVMQLNMAG